VHKVSVLCPNSASLFSLRKQRRLFSTALVCPPVLSLSVCLSVCLLFCLHDNSKFSEWISLIFDGKVQSGLVQTSCHFCGYTLGDENAVFLPGPIIVRCAPARQWPHTNASAVPAGRPGPVRLLCVNAFAGICSSRLARIHI